MAQIGGQALNLYKRLGETPRERLERLRKERPHYEFEVLSYAGRLDPMAEGVLICLVGAENSHHEQWLDLPKEYTLDILFGFATDTYDILGKVMQSGDTTRIGRALTEQGLNEFRGMVSQEYPPFSSKTVEGKSLFQWARDSMLGSVSLPRKTVTVYDIELKEIYKVKEAQLLAYIEENVAKVNGDFRQEEILRMWNRYLKKGGNLPSAKGGGEAGREFPCATVKISCSSGTYARSIAHGLGQHLGVPALALHILRTKVGEYSVEKSLK